MEKRVASRSLLSVALVLGGLLFSFTPLAAEILINEVDADTPGTDAAEFLELYDGGVGNSSLTGYVLVFYNGATDQSYLALDLDTLSTDGTGFFVAGNTGVPGVDLVFAGNILQNGADAVALYTGNAVDFPVNTPVTTTNLVDALVYDTSDADDAGLLVLLNAAQPQINEDSGGNSDVVSNQRCPDGSGGARNTTTYSQANPSPGLLNTCPLPPVAVAIHDVQGNGALSPLDGDNVIVSGIVTGRKSNGFFLQAADADADADAATSEAVFVFTSSAPPAAAVVGNEVDVTGVVSEFSPAADPLQPPFTEVSSSSVVLVSSGNPLPTAVVLDDEPTTGGAFDQLERYESMRVSVPSLTVVAPTGGTTTEPSATATTNGVFFGVVPGTPRPFREAGVQLPDPLPTDGSCPAANVPRFDTNPERLRVDSDAIGHAAIEVATGAVVTGLAGPLDYAFRTYTVLPDAGATVNVTPGMAAAATAPPDNDEITIASFNLERFFDDADDPAITEPILTLPAYSNRLQKASLIVRAYLHAPDVVGLVEMENLATVQDLAAQIDADALAAGQPQPGYAAFLVEGNDVGGIDVGFLAKSAPVAPGTARVVVDAVTQLGKNTVFVEPTSGASLLNDRPPLVLEATAHDRSGASFPFVVVVNHLRSLNGISDTAAGSGGWASGGDRVRNKRQQQAEFLAGLVESRQVADPLEPILLVGDFNAFEVNDGFADVMGTIVGLPAPASQVCVAAADLVTANLSILAETAPLERYSYSFDGNAQTLDHAVANPALLALASRVRLDHARVDADFAEIDRNDYSPGFPRRLSDHDPLLAYFRIPGFTLFADGFDSHDTSRWSAAVP